MWLPFCDAFPNIYGMAQLYSRELEDKRTLVRTRCRTNGLLRFTVYF